MNNIVLPKVSRYICDCTVYTSHAMKSIHLHATASYVSSKLMQGCSRRPVLQSYIAGLAYIHGSLMALNRTLAWKVLHMFCLMEMSRLVDLGNTTSSGNATHGKSISIGISTKEFS